MVRSLNSRWECDCGTDTSRAWLARERSGILAGAWGAAEWALLNVVLAPEADLLLHAPIAPLVKVSGKHAESLDYVNELGLNCEDLGPLTGLKAVTLVLPSYGGM